MVGRYRPFASEPSEELRVLSCRASADRSCENGIVTEISQLKIDDQPIDTARLAEVCQRYGVAELSVFGSVARGEVRPDSDVDLLFVLAPDARLGFALFELEDELAGIFGREVDLLSKDSVHRLIRDAVLAESQLLYAA